MKLAVFVTEYPKATETFILRDLMVFLNAGIEVRLYHLSAYRHTEILHEFAKPTRDIAIGHPTLFGSKVLGSVLKNLVTRPFQVGKVIANITRAHFTEPALAAKSLGLIPKSLLIADELREWGADHIHAEFAGHPATSAWIVGRTTQIPYSVSCRAHDIFRTQNLLKEKLGEASFVRTVSKFNKRFLLKEIPSLEASKLHVIHSSVDIETIPKLSAPQNDIFNITYVGSLQVRKGIDILLTTLAELNIDRPWNCVIIGGGPEETKLKALCSTLGLDNHVKFTGPQAFEEIAKAYEKASVVVAPSIIGPNGRTEGIPNVVIEALAYQRPAISTNVSGIPELIDTGVEGILVEPGSVSELKAALEKVANEPEQAYDMAKRGRVKVEQEFSLAQNATRQIELFSANGAKQLEAMQFSKEPS